jgi:dihydropteroate synthase
METSWMRSFAKAEFSRPPSRRRLPFTSRGWLLGVVNVTPDSFYATSRALSRNSALAMAERCLREGAAGIDVGAESTRPGSLSITADEERRRLIPVIEAMRKRFPDVLISVDTQKSSVALLALAAGADLINDISAFRTDPAMATLAAETRAPVILMHMQGTPATMQKRPRYKNVIDDIKAFFEERLRFAARAGIREDRILLDPGIGFGKTVHHNLQILKNLRAFLKFGRPLVVGVSRKGFIGKILGGSASLPAEERLEGTLSACLWALTQGAAGLRVHDVLAVRRAVRMWQAMESAAP